GEGRAEGRAEGIATGRAEGRAEGKEDVALEMIKENEEPSKISKFTHLSLERINELKALLSNNIQLASE
ncbi:MAG: hypothetical protein LIO44_03170, partial [Eubacterium sp.]|nr:hypothetical protein [Eubacterium sp.]